MDSNISKYFDSLKQWQEELSKLRQIALDCGLVETFKWMHPCYTFNGKNIIIIHEFKEYCGLSFFKGALLKDEENILIQPTEQMQSARQLRFTTISEINELQPIIKRYINEAVEVEKLGLKVKTKSPADYDVPEELNQVFKAHPDFENAFKSLTPGRQKGYLLHFSKPKQSKTKTSRIEQNMQRIFEGYGLTDCTCGLSKRKPNCDGSHKQLLKT